MAESSGQESAANDSNVPLLRSEVANLRREIINLKRHLDGPITAFQRCINATEFDASLYHHLQSLVDTLEELRGLIEILNARPFGAAVDVRDIQNRIDGTREDIVKFSSLHMQILPRMITCEQSMQASDVEQQEFRSAYERPRIQTKIWSFGTRLSMGQKWFLAEKFRYPDELQCHLTMNVRGRDAGKLSVRCVRNGTQPSSPFRLTITVMMLTNGIISSTDRRAVVDSRDFDGNDEIIFPHFIPQSVLNLGQAREGDAFLEVRWQGIDSQRLYTSVWVGTQDSNAREN